MPRWTGALAGATPSRGDHAVALELPDEALSFRKMGDLVSWGIEMDGRYERVDPWPSRSPTHSRWGFRVDLSRMRSWKTEGPVDPFLTSGVGFQINAHSRIRRDEGARWWFRQRYYLTVVPGVSWRPWGLVTLWARQRLEIGFGHEERRLNRILVQTTQPEILAVFRW